MESFMKLKKLFLLILRLSVVLSVAIGMPALAADIKVLAPNAAKEAVLEAITVFEKSTGHKVLVSWTGTEAITRRVAEGEVVDLVVNAAQNIDQQSRDGKLIGATRTDFARSGIGVAVPATSAKVDVSKTESLKAALLSAKTVVVSSGTSGRHMVEVFTKLGIGEPLKAKTRQPPSGAQIADFLAAGDADLGFQQVSELLHAKGIHYLGTLPADLQSYTVYSAALHAGAANPEAARALLAALRSPAVKSVVSKSGMEPV
jgi:molybdate transport system substrate-binding protein